MEVEIHDVATVRNFHNLVDTTVSYDIVTQQWQ